MIKLTMSIAISFGNQERINVAPTKGRQPNYFAKSQWLAQHPFRLDLTELPRASDAEGDRCPVISADVGVPSQPSTVGRRRRHGPRRDFTALDDGCHETVTRNREFLIQ
jgi:hypothetical protein